ncbi:hypothetical protein D3C85_906660 [compost metagenome]
MSVNGFLTISPESISLKASFIDSKVPNVQILFSYGIAEISFLFKAILFTASHGFSLKIASKTNTSSGNFIGKKLLLRTLFTRSSFKSKGENVSVIMLFDC